MAMFDLPLAQLQSYRPDMPEPDDLDEFWSRTLAETRGFDLAAQATKIDTGLPVLDTYDVSFAGFGGTLVRAWLNVPAGAHRPLPAVVEYLGYSGNRGFPFSSTLWAQAGYAHFVMDTRGQGWSSGGIAPTADAHVDAGIAHTPGFMTSGITNPEHYYYRRVFSDAIRILEVASRHPLVDPDQIIVTGGSQGGGISIAAAGLAPLAGITLAGCAADVPFLCCFPRALEICDQDPYQEITDFLAGWTDQVGAAYRTLSYFDGAILGRLATAPALFSVGLMDPVCPPSTVYAAFNYYGAGADVSKKINIYSHNQHEGGKDVQKKAQLEWVASLVG